MRNLEKYFDRSKALMWLILTNVAISLLLALAGLICSLMHTGNAWISEWFTLSSSVEQFITRPWTIITYQVTQVSLLHLIFNMLWLLWFGKIFLYRATDQRLLTAYFGGGMVAGILYLVACNLVSEYPGAYLIGSSAAVLSVMTAAAIMAPDMRLNLFLIGEVKLKWIAIVCIIFTFFGIGNVGSGGKIAHLSGITFGAIYALWLNHRRGFGLNISKKLSRFSWRPSHRQRPKNPQAAAKAMNGRLCDEERLDQLLDKVRLSGYESLSAAEKRELNAISKRL